MAIRARFPYCGGSQDLMDYGCGGLNQYFNVQQQKQQQQQQQQQQQCNMHQLLNYQLQRNHNLLFDNTLVSASKNNTSNHLSMDTMASYDEKQRQEIDHYIRLQNERLRLVLREQKRQQLSLLLKKVESKAFPILKQKDEEITRAAKRTVELEDFLKRLEFENQTWQRMAQENEAKVTSLNNKIEQLREHASGCFNNDAEDAESCCDVIREEEGFLDDADNTARKMVMVCRGCNSRNSCILFLPCRHLCSCKACDACLDACPVCQTPKKASIEALMV